MVKTAGKWEDTPIETGLSEERIQTILHSSQSLQFITNAFFLSVFSLSIANPPVDKSKVVKNAIFFI